ncbi:MAG TPA: carboxypeptidase-like regulatory domain-containing protein, partial [Kofleriaceae bacterium]|nr:carboxypeptidase-like regulatory domain-containing protein [Kofleriaceae bacterium]
MNRRRWSIGLAAVAATILVAVLALSQSPTKLVDDIRGHGKTRSVKPVALSTTSSIAGTVRDQAGSPIAGARVCAQTKDRETACAPTAVDGTYTIEYLFPLAYEVTAYAPTLQPGRYHPDGDVRRDRFVLAAAERRTGVDIVLEGGAVELTGKVLDIGGGPIGRANVRVAREDFDINEWRHWYPAVETADDGSFRLWVAPGDHQIEATADGYAHVEHEAIAPGSIDLLLTPAGSIAGTIVDRDNQPVADALVVADAIDVHVQARSDDGGHFLIEGLVPMRYDVSARTTTGYGTAVGSVLVGLGAHVDGIIIRVDPAAHIVGRVLTAPPATLCPPADVLVKLHDPFGEDVEMSVAADGTLHADGVIASTY